MKTRFQTYCIQSVFLLLLLTVGWSRGEAQQILCAQADGIEAYAVDAAENSGEGTTGSTYSWFVDEASFTGTIVPTTSSGNQIEIDWTTSPPGSYTLTVIETNTFNCSTQQELLIALQDPPAVSITAPPLVCEGEQISLLATLGGSASSVTWSSSGDGTFSDVSSLSTTYSLSANDVTTGNVEFFATTDDPAGDLGCDEVIETVTVEVETADEAVFSIANTYCFGDQTQPLPTVSDNGIAGTWSQAIIDTDENGVFAYVFEPDDSCDATFDLEVTINPCGCVFEFTEEFSICQGETFTFPDGTVADTNMPGEFIVEIRTPVPDDCDVLTTYVLRVDGPGFPTAFSPNQINGMNDEFGMLINDDLCEVTDYRLQIFNRWGEVVFETTDLSEGWNGHINGSTDEQFGLFIWTAEYQLDGNLVEQNGTIQIVQ